MEITETPYVTMATFKVTNENGEKQLHATIIPKSPSESLENERSDTRLDNLYRDYYHHIMVNNKYKKLSLVKSVVTKTTNGPAHPRDFCLILIIKID